MGRIEQSSGGAYRVLGHAALVLSLLLTLPGAFAQGEAAKNEKPLQESMLMTSWMNTPYARNGMNIYAPDLPLWRFLVSYYSNDLREQRVAYAFLLGVADTTERKIWCSHDDYTPDTILETINEGLKKMNLSRYDDRAAFVLTEILMKKYPCKKGEVLPNSFIQGVSVHTRKYDFFKKRTPLAGEGLTKEWVIQQGEDGFAPNLSLRRFWVSFENPDIEEQNISYAYFAGVSEATEGKTWCGYRYLKTLSIIEIIYSDLMKKNDPSGSDERAAYVVSGILEKSFPYCKKER